MSDRVVQSVNDTSGRNRQSVQPYQSVWMAHWIGTNCDATAEETRSHNAFGNEELDYATRDDNLMKGLEVSRPAKGYGRIETKTSEIVNESLKMSSKSMGNEGTSSSMFNYGQDIDDMKASGAVFGNNLERGKAVDSKSGIQFPSLIPGIPTANEISSRRCHALGEGTSKNLPKWMKTYSTAKDSSFATPKPLQEAFVEPSSHIVPYGFDLKKYEFDKGKAVVSPLISRSTIASKRLSNTDLVGERKMDCHPHSLNACLTESNTCDHYLSTFGREWFPKMQKCSGSRLFPSQYTDSEKTETKKSCNDCYSLQKLQNCVHDVETMRFCTTVDSVEGMPRGCPRFSQTTHSLLITKKTDVNTLKENDIFRSTRVITQINGNKSSDLHCLSPFFGQRGLKLQALSSSTDCEGKENVGDVKASRVTINNESSAETDTMDMDSFKEKNPERNPHSGAYPTSSTKAFDMDSNLPPRIDVVSSREVARRCSSTGLPDINLELPALAADASSSENACPSSSKTQSLEMDKLLAHAEQPRPKSNLSLNDCPNADPGIRWIKRLKMSSSNSSAQGTKSSNLAENSSHEKMSKFFSRILKSGITSSEPTPRKHHGKESVLSDKSGDCSKKDKVDPENKGKESLLSHAWIRRWLHNGSRITEKKPKTMVVCEPQNLKFSLDNLQKEQFPSIAAMALMGKSMTGFQQCELQKRGSFTVWNTKTF